jgi:hypothetical protein
MKYEIESLKAQVSSFLYQQGQEQSQMPMQHASAMITNVTYYEPTQPFYVKSTVSVLDIVTTAADFNCGQTF